MAKGDSKICLVGHPFAPTGRGEDVRCTFRALRDVYFHPALMDVYRLTNPDVEFSAEFSTALTEKPSDVNIFFLNGDEIEQAMKHMAHIKTWPGRNIVYPAWELAHYPKEWAQQLDRFDEIWASSRFTNAALESACSRPVRYMPFASEVLLSSFLSRRYFGVPEGAYVFLFFFDARSYATRKNPLGVIEAFRRLLALRPNAKAHLVLKFHGAGPQDPAEEDLRRDLEDLRGRYTLINREMSDNEVKNLVRCCDCFVSLHRSEGFGRGIAEAMLLGKPVVATAFSGNVDFMHQDIAFGVQFNLIALSEGDYPHHQNQVWADPDIEQATQYMKSLVDNPSLGRAIGQRARLHMRSHFSYRAIGMRYREHIDAFT